MVSRIEDLEIPFSRGLENVPVAITSISHIDGKKGQLIYRGYPIEVLAQFSTFEETVYLLWFGDLPNKDELENFKRDLIEHREIPDFMRDCIQNIPKDTHPMEALRTCVSMLGCFDPDKHDMSRGANLRKAVRITAQIATIVAYSHRTRNGLELIRPEPKLSHASNLYYMMTGKEPDSETARIMDVILILHAEHGMNASTFASMVIASTLSDMHSAIVGGIGALRGPLHGGANERVLEMIEEIGSVENVETYIKTALAQHRRIMGFGHRVYKTYDPRAKILKKYAKQLSEKTGQKKWLEIAEKIEDVMIKELGSKGIFPNVDFYSAIVYKMLDLPKEIFTPLFAVARVAGWVAHILEYSQNNRIFRPTSIYNGPTEVEYIPIEER